MASLKSCQASEVINIKDFLSKWDNNVYQLCAQTNFDQNNEIAERIEMSHENVEELESVCREVDNSNSYKLIHTQKLWDMINTVVREHLATKPDCKGNLRFDSAHEVQWGFVWREGAVCNKCHYRLRMFNLYEEINTGKRGRSLDLLKSGYDKTTDRWRYMEWIPPDLDLMCVRFQKQELERRECSSVYLNNVTRKMKYKKTDQYLMYHSNMDPAKYAEIPEECRVIYPDVLLTVNINRPIKRNTLQQDEQAGKAEQRILSNTLTVLGRQKLTDLRDIIRCVHDLTVAGDLSENPDIENQTYAKDLFKSGFFFIEGMFYNDMREDDARDYSEVIRKWANEKGMGPYAAKKMEETIFLDLNLRLGQPYVYMHQGDCEHIIIFSEIRLLCSDDPQDTRRYPYLQRKLRRNRTLCRVCCMQAARWIVYGSEFTPENPCFFCDICFRSLHYDHNNKKLGEFEAYRYFDHHAII